MKLKLPIIAILLLGTVAFFSGAAPDEVVGGPTKAQILAQLESQNYILTEEQKPVFRDILKNYTIQPEDLPTLKKVVLANGFEIDRIKDSVLYDKIKNDVRVQVEDAVAVLDKEDKIELKKDRFLRLKSNLPKTVVGNTYTIEVIDIKPLDGGIAVFARAWEDGQQIGFGEDGTVDIERFRFYNPPVLVPDPIGTIERTSYDELTGSTTVTKYREDYQTVLKLALEHTISIVGKDGSNIIAGKIGQTTTTVYPDADPETSTVDGRTFRALSSETWTSIHDGAGNGATPTATNNICVFIDEHTTTDRWSAIFRAVFLFDTSAVGSDTVSSATFSVYPQANGYDTYTGITPQIGLVSSNPTSNTNLVAGDYALAKWGTTDFATRKNMTALTTGSYSDFSLNASGISNINGSGISKFGLRVGLDIDDSSGSWEGNKEAGVNLYQADQTGTANDPTLVMEHASGPAEATATSSSVYTGNTAIQGNSIIQ